MRWYHPDEDPFIMVGFARLIVVRHNQEHNYRGRKDNCTHIINVETYQNSFICPEITKNKYYEGQGPSLDWMKEEIGDNCAHKVNHLFKSLPNGIYELVGDMYHWSSRSYEGEWDGDSELRNTKIQAINFSHAMLFECEVIYDDLQALLPHSESRKRYYSHATDIHPYMTKQQILVNQANSLSIILDGYSNKPSYNDMKIEDLENCIFMLMLRIDSEKQIMQPKSLKIDEMVKSCLESNRRFMDSES